MNTLLKSAGGITQVSADSRLLSNFDKVMEEAADLSGGKDRCGQCGGVCPSDPDPESGEHGEGDPCPGQQCWRGDQLRSHDLRCDPGKPGTGRALLHRTCVQHGGRDRCVRIAWKIYPAAWGDDDP